MKGQRFACDICGGSDTPEPCTCTPRVVAMRCDRCQTFTYGGVHLVKLGPNAWVCKGCIGYWQRQFTAQPQILASNPTRARG